MKKLKSAVAVVISALLAFSMCLSVSAATIVSYGDYSYAANGDGTYMLYSYDASQKNLTLPDNIMGLPVVGIYENCFKNSDIRSVSIPDTYTSIGKSAFYGCTALTSITIPDSVTAIGEMAFASCTGLASVEFSGEPKIRKIPYSAFNGDTSLSGFAVPDSVTEIASYAFANCGLQSIELPDSVNKTDSYAFWECSALESVKLPAALTEVSDYCFCNCSSLSVVELPKNLTSIGDRAFSGCSQLSQIDLTPTLTSIGKYAFYSASSLSELFVPDSVTSIGAEAFSPMSYSNTITVSYFENSYAQTYCYENYIKKVVACEKLMGDANLDGVVNINDVSYIQMFRLGRVSNFSCRARELSDVNSDKDVTLRDATTIQMYLAKMITEL